MLESLKNISTLTKERFPEQKTLDVLRSNIHDNPTPELLNLLRFFEELGQDFSGLKTGWLPKQSYSFYEKHMKDNSCHTNSMIIAHAAKSQFDFIYGYVDNCLIGYNETIYVETNQHSFLMQKEPESIFDPTTSWNNINREKSEIMETLPCGKNYFGVYIPMNILLRASAETARECQNISYYLKEFVFVDDQKTEELIAELKFFKTKSETVLVS